MPRGLLAIASLFVCLSYCGRAEDKKDEKPDPDLKKFEGKWEITYHETAGVEDTQDQKWTMEVKGSKYTITTPDGTVSTGTVRFDSSKKPKHLDYTVVVDEKVEKYTGIYELKDDEYKTCDVEKGKDRPTEFKTNDPTGQVAVWKRVKVKD